MMPPAVGYAILGFLAVCLAGAAYGIGRAGFAAGRSLGAARERALGALGAGMVVVSPRGRVASIDAEARILLGLQGTSAAAGEVSEAVDSFRIMSAMRDIPGLAALIAAGEGGAEIELGEAAGRRRIEARAFRFGRSGRGAVLLLLSDITETSTLLAELSALASKDALTGAYNRRRFDELGGRDIELSRRSGKSVGVLMLDLDLFKGVNDEYGHHVGDELLIAACSSFKEALRSTDVLARYGGEEFAVLLPDSGAEDSVSVAERLRARIGGLSIPCEGKRVSVTASVGVYSGVPAQGEDLALFLRRADEALYRSKAQGRDKVSYWDPMPRGKNEDNDRAYQGIEGQSRAIHRGDPRQRGGQQD
jgi:diguanylate cyclase (GGDEF)-like protein